MPTPTVPPLVIVPLLVTLTSDDEAKIATALGPKEPLVAEPLALIAPLLVNWAIPFVAMNLAPITFVPVPVIEPVLLMLAVPVFTVAMIAA